MYSAHIVMAVSFLHEGLTELVRKQPDFVRNLLTQCLGIGVPPSASARLSESTLSEPVPAEYHADGAVVFVTGDAPTLGAIVETQLEQRERKRFTWPHYATGARARHECPFIVVVLAPDPSVARWAAEPIDLGFGSVFRPHVVGPDQVPVITDPAVAARDLPLAGLSVVAHGKGPPEAAAQIALAVATAAAELRDTDQSSLYFGLIESALSAAAQEILQMMPEAPKYFSESQRATFDKGKIEGKIEGKIDSLLELLSHRRLRVTDDQRRRIIACSDPATLDRWFTHALSAASVDELLG